MSHKPSGSTSFRLLAAPTNPLRPLFTDTRFRLLNLRVPFREAPPASFSCCDLYNVERGAVAKFNLSFIRTLCDRRGELRVAKSSASKRTCLSASALALHVAVHVLRALQPRAT